MAQFVPKTSEQILRDAIDYLYLNTNLSDFNVGSVIRTILEVMAVEDANQYYQMVNILESFFLNTASGPALNDRAAQYDVTRRPATSSSGEALFLDTHLQRSFLINDVAVAAGILYVENASLFGDPPFMVQLGEGGDIEQVRINAIDATTGALTIDAAATPPFNQTTYSHLAAATGIAEIDNRARLVCLFDANSADRIISSGITLRAEPTNVTFEIECMTIEMGTHQNGYFASNPIKVRSNTVGIGSNVPEGRLNQIVGGSPYSGAAVTNTSTISGGREAESDSELRDRIRQHVASLAAGTISALLDGLLTTSDSITGSIVTRASIQEDFEKEIVYAYIDDSSSTGIAASEERHAQDTLAVAAAAADTSLSLNSIGGFTSTSTISNATYIIIDPLNAEGVGPFINAYSSLLVSPDILEGLLVPVPAGGFPVSSVVSECEVLTLSSEKNRKYYQVSKTPLGDDAFLLFVVGGVTGIGTLQVQLPPGQEPTLTPAGTFVQDYLLNEATGQIEFLTGKVPIDGSGVFAIYENYTNLIKEAQKVVDGDLTNITGYPGIRSAGVKVLVRPAGRSGVDVTVNLTVDEDITDTDTATFLVKQTIISYVNNLDLGETLIISEIIERAMGVFGVTNVKVIEPITDQAINSDTAWYALDVTVV